MHRTVWLFALLSHASAVLADDWPRFRGPNGSGVTRTSRLPPAIGQDITSEWKTAVPPGHSSPVVVGTTIYLTGFENESLITSAYDRDTGRQLWRQSIPQSRKSKRHSLN